MEKTTKNPSARYSTKEVASRLFLSEIRTRHLLLAASVPCSKCGAAYLWDAEAVERVITALGTEGEAAR
jgi:hypothetical protein